MNDDDTVSDDTKRFLEDRLKQHSCVANFNEISHREYRIERSFGDEIHLYLTGKYVFGLFDFHRVVQANYRVNCVVLASAWLNYTGEAKREAIERNSGLFDIGELLGALNRRHSFWAYERPKRD